MVNANIPLNNASQQLHHQKTCNFLIGELTLMTHIMEIRNIFVFSVAVNGIILLNLRSNAISTSNHWREVKNRTGDNHLQFSGQEKGSVNDSLVNWDL